MEEGTATHSSILAWRIPWTEDPGGLQSMGRKKSDMTEVTRQACMHSLTKKEWTTEVTESFLKKIQKWLST